MLQEWLSLVSIQNNTALKLDCYNVARVAKFGKHSKQHSSKTQFLGCVILHVFGKHSKQHSSKTHTLEPFQALSVW